MALKLGRYWHWRRMCAIKDSNSKVSVPVFLLWRSFGNSSQDLALAAKVLQKQAKTKVGWVTAVPAAAAIKTQESQGDGVAWAFRHCSYWRSVLGLGLRCCHTTSCQCKGKSPAASCSREVLPLPGAQLSSICFGCGELPGKERHLEHPHMKDDRQRCSKAAHAPSKLQLAGAAVSHSLQGSGSSQHERGRPQLALFVTTRGCSDSIGPVLSVK